MYHQNYGKIDDAKNVGFDDLMGFDTFSSVFKGFSSSSKRFRPSTLYRTVHVHSVLQVSYTITLTDIIVMLSATAVMDTKRSQSRVEWDQTLRQSSTVKPGELSKANTYYDKHRIASRLSKGR